MALYRSHTLAALVAELRERAVAGELQESLIGWLVSLVKCLGIKMRTDKCTAQQYLDLWGLPPKNLRRKVPVVIESGMLRSNLIKNWVVSLSLAVAAAAVAVCAPSATGP